MSQSEQIRWIVFDAVGTLFDADPPVAEVYYRIGREYGSVLSLEEVRQRFRDVFRRRLNTAGLAASPEAEYEFWRTVVCEVLPDATPGDACFSKLHAWFAAPSAWKCFDDVAETLSALKASGFLIAIGSNFDERLHSVRAGLPQLAGVDVCLASSEIGWRKPHPEFFQAVMKACRCPADRMLFVGDDPEVDVRGARQAGLEAMLIDRGRKFSGFESDSTLRSLTELIGRFATDGPVFD